RPPNLGGYKIPNPTYELVTAEIRKKLEELKPEKIITGMAQGADQYAANVAIYLGIPFVAAIPCDDQDKLWPKESRENYQKLLEKASEIVVVTPGPYSKNCMHIRDRWIVDNSDALLAIWSGIKEGGTYATIRMAEKDIAKGRIFDIYIIGTE